jgi:serine/threonine-protein kinase
MKELLPALPETEQAFSECGIQVGGSAAILGYIENNRYLLRNRPQCFNHGDYHVGNLMPAGYL